MKKLLLGFEDFNKKNKIFEAAGQSFGTQCIIAASNASEKKEQERFITEVSMMDPNELNSMVNSAMAKGKSLLSAFDSSWKKRISAGLDKGTLTKKGNWYIGEGAWRINSAKANHLGMAPSGVKYYDPMQQELLEKYFNEDFGKSNLTVSSTGEIAGLGFDKEFVPREDELVTSESLKYLKKMYESDDEFTLGPPSGAKNAVVVDTKKLVEQLVDNFFLETRDNVMIWGAPGIGKTEVIKSVAKVAGERLGKKVPVLVVTLATKAAYDIAGIPILFAEQSSSANVLGREMRGQVGMDFAYPAWLPPPNSDEDGILFFDEINRADVDVMGAALTLLLDRTSGSYVMPDGWRVWAAGNREMDGPVKPFEGAMASRFLGGHFHLVPTVESWSEWAQSDNAFFKGTGDLYIPQEFLAFLKLKDVVGVSKQGTTGTISNLGRQYRVKFDYFYNWDKTAAAESGGGKMDGFPNPRTWTKAFSNIYQKIRSTPELMAQASTTINPKYKVISLFGVALLNQKIERDILMKISAIVGTEAADAFIQFAKQLARLNDSNGTLVEKIENVFNNPKGPRPLLDIPKLGADEVFGVLNAIEGAFDGLVSNGKMGAPELINWLSYCLALEDDKKASQGETTQHTTAIIQKHVLLIRRIMTPENKELTPAMQKVFKEFLQRHKDIGGAISGL